MSLLPGLRVARRLARRVIRPKPRISIIVVFYNMQREAQRTLLSLSRGYQEALDGIGYEVLCIDNGSSPPMERSFVESYGPEFRLIRPEPALPSACRAINEAARQARGDYLCIMIDGAHILSPGVLAQANEAFTAHPGAIVALRQWFVGGDQRWLSDHGYTREREDQLFGRSYWPEKPYSIFDISRPMQDPSGGWYNSMAETNCLFLPKRLFADIGGFDERFDEPGSGFANLDFFDRAATAARGPIVALLWEASFHQFHGGTTTNASERQKNRLVSEYNQKYRRLKDRGFNAVEQQQLLYFGRIRSPSPLQLDQRPLFAGVPLTNELRRRSALHDFTRNRRTHVLSRYVEDGSAHTEWLGESIDLFPADLIAIQEIIQRVRPDCVVMPNASRGLVNFVGSMLKIMDEPSHIIWPSTLAEPLAKPFVTTSALRGVSTARPIIAEVRRLTAQFDRIVVLYTISPEFQLHETAITPYARMVSANAYFAILGTANGRPYVGYSTWDASAVMRSVMQKVPGLFMDNSWDHRHVLIASPDGYYKRAPDLKEAFDETIDKEFAESQPS